jgi:hypothetical protein
MLQMVPFGTATRLARPLGGDAIRPTTSSAWLPATRSPRQRGEQAEHIDEATGVEVDDPGDQHPGVLGGGGEERGLIEADRGGSTEAGEVIDAGSAVIAGLRSS